MDNTKEMSVFELNYDAGNNSAIVILKSKEEPVILPLWIGIPEARSIMIGLSKAKLEEGQRPLSHDLLQEVINLAGFELQEVMITSLEKNTFYAQIKLKTAEGLEFFKDCRPSDGIAMAVRNDLPIKVCNEVYEKSALQMIIEDPAKKELNADEDFNSFVDNISPEDFGKYARSKLNFKDSNEDEVD